MAGNVELWRIFYWKAELSTKSAQLLSALYLPTSQAIGEEIDLGAKRYRILNSFSIFKIKIKKSKTYRKACPVVGLSIGTTLGRSL
jgi:hypothetical protein